MKKILIFVVFCLFFLWGCNVEKQEIPQIDFDYYVDALVEKEYQNYLTKDWNDFISKEEFLTKISLEWDPENYYGRLGFLYAENDIVFAFFLREKNIPIIVMDDRVCGPVCHQTFTFSTYEDGVWTDVSEIFPFLSDAMEKAKTQELQVYLEAAEEDSDVNFLYDLPQKGTTIQMVNQYDSFHDREPHPVYEFDWDWVKGVFTARELPLE